MDTRYQMIRVERAVHQRAKHCQDVLSQRDGSKSLSEVVDMALAALEYVERNDEPATREPA